MTEINYIGEHLLPGKLGNAFILIAFISAIVSAYSYFVATQKRELDNSGWVSLGRKSYLFHAFGIFGIIATIFYMLLNEMYEYYYIWQHSSSILPLRYILSCFWEGQEGSFLLWAFWHVVLGLILMKNAKNWEPPVLAVIALVQVFITSMLLGIYVGDYRLGSNPFVLLREHADFLNLPFVQKADYLAKLDGRGLNPLLQNYWMTIHPPTLFLGFASTIVPFAYAIAALWTKQYKSWIKPAFPWVIFGVMILGIGILMGGAWAYEALSFGGFWAWDPVENASLVPWLTFVAALHMMHIANARNKSFGITFIFSIATFLLILYSTFLTRSGILGDSSVHAFTDLGMSGQLLVYLLVFLFLAIILLAVRWKDFPKNKEEEKLWSKEFWLFIGSLMLGISAFIISFSTSYPVINKLFGTEYAVVDVIEHYNKTQIPIAIIILLLLGFTQFLKYKSTNKSVLLKHVTVSLATSILVSIAIAYYLQFDRLVYVFMLFAGVFGVFGNLDYWLRISKGQSYKTGASVTHIGVALILLGALISTSKSENISPNTSQVDLENLNADFKNNENIMLQQGDTLAMNNYHIVYANKKKEGVNIFYDVEYYTQKNGKYNKEFTLQPVIQTNPRMGNVAEPATKHYWNKDIYTHLTYAVLDDDNKPDNPEDYREPIDHAVGLGDTIYTSNSLIVVKGFDKNIDVSKYGLKKSDFLVIVAAELLVYDKNGNSYTAKPIYGLTDKSVFPIEDAVKELGLVFAFWKIDPKIDAIHITVAEKKNQSKDFVIMKAIIFPYINVLWLGCILLLVGSLIAIWERIKTNQLSN